jgi:hypothetical protein
MTKTSNILKTQSALLTGAAEGVRKVYTARKTEVAQSVVGQRVSDAVEKAKQETDKLVRDTHTTVQTVISEVQKDVATVKAEALKAAKEASTAQAAAAPTTEKDPNHAPEVIAEVTRVGHIWSIHIPELDVVGSANSYADVQERADIMAAEALNVKKDEVNVFVVRVAADAEPVTPDGAKVDPEYAKVTQEKKAEPSFLNDPTVKEVRAKLLASGRTLLNSPEVREAIKQAAKKRYPRR